MGNKVLVLLSIVCLLVSPFVAKEAFAANPEGYLESADCNTIRGWARDPDTPAPIKIHLYADGKAGKGHMLFEATAALNRNDLPFRDKNHGFEIPLPQSLKDGRKHKIYAYAIDSGGRKNSELKGSGMKVQCRAEGGSSYESSTTTTKSGGLTPSAKTPSGSSYIPPGSSSSNNNSGMPHGSSMSAELVEVKSGKDYVSTTEYLRRDGKPDSRIRLSVTAPGSVLSSLEIRQRGARYPMWDTVKRAAMAMIAVELGGQILNRSDGSILIPLGQGRTSLDLYVQDGGLLYTSGIVLDVTAGFSNGQKLVAQMTGLPGRTGAGSGGFGGPPSNTHVPGAPSSPDSPRTFPPSSGSLDVSVPATSCVYLAGQRPGVSIDKDSAPSNSPVAVDVRGALSVTIEADGEVSNTGRSRGNGPDGLQNEVTSRNSYNDLGISLVRAPMGSLVGVFTSGGVPEPSRRPRQLNGPTTEPRLQQTFFVGSGPVTVTVPQGAAYLYFGIHELYNWTDNSGSFRVNVKKNTSYR